MRSEKQRSTVKSIIFGFIILMLLIALIGSCTSGNDEPEAEVTQEQKVAEEKAKQEEKSEQVAVDRAEEEIKAEEKAKAEAEVEKAKEDQAFLEGEALKLLQESFDGVGTVTFDEGTKTYAITSTDPNFMVGVLMVASGEAPQDIWTMVVDSTVYLSESITNLLGKGYTVAMVNPDNPERLLLVVENGIVTYDVIEQEEL